MKYLTTALLTEGDSYRSFLLPVLQRQLDASGLAAGFDVGRVRTSSVHTVDHGARVSCDAAELLGECHLLFVHHDQRERAKVDNLRAQLNRGSELVGIVPVRETEAWVLAAMYGLHVPGLDPACRPDPVKTAEKDPDPKATLRRAYTRGDPVSAFTRVGEQVDLDVLCRLPAYQAFLEDLNAALKEQHFL